jgi:S-adenosylmethionine-diacylgycerolhomoserine-N-methlytransferase
VRLYGLDISREMLALADAKLEGRAVLAAGDATAFDPGALFGATLGATGFDHVVLSYALSMIPDWQGTIAHAAGLLAPGGRIHIVDFGDLADLPRPMSGLLRGWLRLFHVTPRDDMSVFAARIATRHGLAFAKTHGPLRYYQLITLSRA